MSAIKLILLRHGESVWNRDKRFTGWTDIDLSPRGIRQAERAGHLFREHHCGFDVCFTRHVGSREAGLGPELFRQLGPVGLGTVQKDHPGSSLG